MCSLILLAHVSRGLIGIHMASIDERAARAAKIASVLRPLGNGVLSRQQAERAAQLLGVHCTTVYRLRRRFLADSVASTLEPRQPGRATGGRLDAAVECVIDEAVHEWLPDQRHLAHPATDLVLEVKRRCSVAGLSPPSRSTIARRWLSYREQDALARAALPNAAVAPGTFQVRHPLDIVQVDHTQADILLVSELDGQIIGRPWLSVALDVATRCVLGFYVAMERPGAATVSLLLSRVVLRKEPWLERLGVEADWPMRGIPKQQSWRSGTMTSASISSCRASCSRIPTNTRRHERAVLSLWRPCRAVVQCGFASAVSACVQSVRYSVASRRFASSRSSG
ncbi:helix-turn-helix domain-containing protein [Burkholderia cepacia]|uniref:helix-turn-helix domain-containing protein n=1 Tax=Burkholderia cepacia TaxID=292 RepID=UPI00267EF95E